MNPDLRRKKYSDFEKRHSYTQMEYSKTILQKKRTVTQRNFDEIQKNKKVFNLDNDLIYKGSKAMLVYDKHLKMNKIITVSKENVNQILKGLA